MAKSEIDKITLGRILRTTRYDLTYKQFTEGGPAGYESTYLGAQQGEPGEERMFNLLEEISKTGIENGCILAAKYHVITQRNGPQFIFAMRQFLEALAHKESTKGKTLGIASGFKPSGAYHFGHKLTSSTVAFFQKNGVQVFMPIADIEAECAKMSRELYMRWAADNLLDWGANGIDLDATHVYLQSEEHKVGHIASVISKQLTFQLAADIYGMDKLIDDMAFLYAGITQVGDIILPQHPDFGNYHSFMVSGPDQDGHMKMVVALVEKELKKGRNLLGINTLPSGFYIPHIRSFTGIKASSSEEEGTIYLGSAKKELDLEKRIKRAEEIIKTARDDSRTEMAAKGAALDLIRYLDFFYERSLEIKNRLSWIDAIADFGEDKELMGKYREMKEKGGSPEKIQALFDNFLLAKCEKKRIDPVQIVLENIGDVLTEQQKRRKIVLEYALQLPHRCRPLGARYRGEKPVEEAPEWNMEDSGVKRPDFWDVPDIAIVNPYERNDTQWFDVIQEAHRNKKLIP